MRARSDSRIAAVVLAAGKSSRMGETKQLIRLGGGTLLERVIDTVESSGVDDIVVVLGHEANQILRTLAGRKLRTVVNDAYREGMGTSLRAGISVLPPETAAAMIVLADQPFVRPETLKLLMDQYRNSGAQIVIPMYKGFRGNPVVLDRSVFPEVMALEGDIGCRAVFGDHLEGIVKTPVEDVGILLDLDSKEDLERLTNFRDAGAEQTALLRPADLQGREIPEPDGSEHRGLVIVGREPVGIAIAKIAKWMNFTVTLVDPLATLEEVPEADRVLHALDFSELPAYLSRYVVVASRGRFDEEAVDEALRSASAYVGLVANRKRAEEIRRSLESKVRTTESLAKVRAPAGLDIGARTPEEIALSIMAEIVLESRKPRSQPSPEL
jgi:CTP:molybdopterin cytidylyltransferase MocA